MGLVTRKPMEEIRPTSEELKVLPFSTAAKFSAKCFVLEVLGITAIPCCIIHRRTTCAFVMVSALVVDALYPVEFTYVNQ